MKKHAEKLALAAVLVLHVVLTLHFEPLSVVLGKDPITVIDYDTHYQQTVRALEAWNLAKRTWAYDPHLLAGQISGAIFDADTKLHELFVIALTRFGVPPARGFNLFIVLAHLLVPPTVYASARLFRLSPAACVTATFLGSMCWFFDSFSHWVFYCGMISYGFAAYATMLPIALFHRFREDRRLWQIAAVAGLLAILHHLHPYSFFILVVPMLVLYLRGFSAWSRRDHAAIVGMALVVIVSNFWWLKVALGFWHYVLDSAFYLDAGASYVAFDYLGLLKEPSTTGFLATRSAFRFLALGAAGLCLWAWRRERDVRYPVLVAAIGGLSVVAYFGGYLPPLRQVQPYRFILPAMFLATLPAAAFLCTAAGDVRERLRDSGWTSPFVLLLGLAAFVAVPRFVRDAVYFLPGFVPKSEIPAPGAPPNVNGPVGFGNIAWPEPLDYKHVAVPPEAKAVVDYVKRVDDGSGRWLVEWWMFGERLAWATNAQVLGGFRELNLGHSDANWFRKHPTGAAPAGELEQYLQRYNVKWVVLSNAVPALEDRKDLFVLEANAGGSRIYRTRVTPSYIEGGGPGTVTARMDHLDVKGSAGGDLVLRYHYLETLRCRPGCTVYRAEVPGDRVGFVGVRGAPPDFEVWNSP
jgi:hypothetical protein